MTAPSPASKPPRPPVLDGAFFRAWITEIADAVDAQRDHLTRLDAAIGDADHGINLARGFGAVREALAGPGPAGPGEVLKLTGTTLISTVGGASGPLYGTVFRRAAKVLRESPEADLSALPALAEALSAALEAVKDLGGAAEGDKTMVDALSPAVTALVKAASDGTPAAEALDAAAIAARDGAQATIGLQARKGRASYLGPRSVGHEDPGAASAALMFRALADVAARPVPETRREP